MIDPQVEKWDCLVLVGDCLDWLGQIKPGTVQLMDHLWQTVRGLEVQGFTVEVER